MQRINIYGIYVLGTLLRDVQEKCAEPFNTWIWTALNARYYLEAMLDPKGPLRIKLSRPSTTGLDSLLGEYVQLHLDEKQDKLDENQVQQLRAAYVGFNNALGLELGQAPTFYVTPQGVYETDALINSAADVYGDFVSAIPAKAVEDTNAAGRCLAFTLPTAAGFHVARALEAIARAWLIEALDAPAGEVDSTKGWANLYSLMGKYNGARKLTKHFDQIRDIDRNPLIHPDDVLDALDAQQLWSICTSLGLSMAREISQAREKSNP